MRSHVIMYHANCSDGLAAAACVIESLRRRGVSSGPIKTIPAQYGIAPDIPTDANVYIVDFCYPPDQIRQIAAVNETVTILDHHKTAADTLTNAVLPKNVSYTFDMSRSGAALAWREFISNDVTSNIIAAIEDRDLWKFALPYTRDLVAGLRAVEPQTPEKYRELIFYQFPHHIETTLICDGHAIEARCRQQVLRYTSSPMRLVLGTFVVPAVNAPLDLASELGHELSRGEPFAALFALLSANKLVVSLRSAEDGEDVSEIAKHYGGGGHKHAAGFAVCGDAHLITTWLGERIRS